MIDWLLAPIDPSRVHTVDFAVSWHGRMMVLAWGVLAPVAVLIARFFKVMPGQDWPRELDNQTWWRSHWMGQTVVLVLSIAGFALVLPADLGAMSLHMWLGYGLLALMVAQVLLGLFRGSKGGPTAPAADGSPRGHHYDMTRWRLTFEHLHKTLGYSALLLGAVVVITGMWKANAPIWMWLSLLAWWSALVTLFSRLQKNGMAIDTYQAIWGTDPAHPGNQMPSPGWGVRRLGDATRQEEDDVRSDRGDRVRSH